MEIYSILILIGILDCLTVVAFYFVYNRSDWPTADGTVIKTWIKKTKAGKYKPVVEYDYDVRGKRYSNNKIAILSPITNNESSAKRICDTYPINKKVTVFHDPNQPEKAILNPTLPLPFIIMLVIGLIFILAGVIGLIF